MSEVTIRDLDKLVEEIKAKEDLIDSLSEDLKSHGKELKRLEGKAILILKDLARQDYESPHGKLVIEHKWRVNLPESDVEKLEFFEWLKEKGIFEKYATVNSNSLNALYFAEERDSEDPMTFSLPGIPAKTLFEKLKFKRRK